MKIIGSYSFKSLLITDVIVVADNIYNNFQSNEFPIKIWLISGQGINQSIPSTRHLYRNNSDEWAEDTLYFPAFVLVLSSKYMVVVQQWQTPSPAYSLKSTVTLLDVSNKASITSSGFQYLVMSPRVVGGRISNTKAFLLSREYGSFLSIESGELVVTSHSLNPPLTVWGVYGDDDIIYLGNGDTISVNRGFSLPVSLRLQLVTTLESSFVVYPEQTIDFSENESGSTQVEAVQISDNRAFLIYQNQRNLPDSNGGTYVRLGRIVKPNEGTILIENEVELLTRSINTQSSLNFETNVAAGSNNNNIVVTAYNSYHVENGAKKWTIVTQIILITENTVQPQTPVPIFQYDGTIYPSPRQKIIGLSNNTFLIMVGMRPDNADVASDKKVESFFILLDTDGVNTSVSNPIPATAENKRFLEIVVGEYVFGVYVNFLKNIATIPPL